MKSRLLTAAAVALVSATWTSASAAAPVEIVYTGPTILESGTDHTLSAYLQEPGTRVVEPTLTFTLGSVSKTATAPKETDKVTVKLKPSGVGEDLPLRISYAGSSWHAAADTDIPVDVYEHVLPDATGGGRLLLNPSRSQARILAGTYDSGLVSVQLQAAGPALALEFDGTDANGDPLFFRGTAVPSRRSFSIAGMAAEPFLLAH